MATTVIFRVWRGKDGDVFALFPHLKGGRDLSTAYQHVGQHSAADYGLCIQNSRPAKPSEYADLARELRGIGYGLTIRQRRTARKDER